MDPQKKPPNAPRGSTPLMTLLPRHYHARVVRHYHARKGASILHQPIDKFDILPVKCQKRGKHGLYRRDRLIDRYGVDAKLFDGSDEITVDCPRKQVRNEYDLCNARCPDLPKLV